MEKILKEAKYGYQFWRLFLISFLINSTLGSVLMVSFIGVLVLAFGGVSFTLFWKTVVGYAVVRILIDKVYPFVGTNLSPKESKF